MGRLRGSVAQDSRRARLSRVIAEWQRQGKTRFSFAEILARYAAAYPSDLATHDSLTSTVSALVHAGELARERGAGRRLLYVPQRPSDVGADDATLAHAVVEIVESHYEAHHSPIPTAAISGELKRRALWPDRFVRLTRLLRLLANEADTRADTSGLSLPAIQRADARTLIGEAVAFGFPLEYQRSARPRRRVAPTRCAARLRPRRQALVAPPPNVSYVGGSTRNLPGRRCGRCWSRRRSGPIYSIPSSATRCTCRQLAGFGRSTAP